MATGRPNRAANGRSRTSLFRIWKIVNKCMMLTTTSMAKCSRSPHWKSRWNRARPIWKLYRTIQLKGSLWRSLPGSVHCRNPFDSTRGRIPPVPWAKHPVARARSSIDKCAPIWVCFEMEIGSIYHHRIAIATESEATNEITIEVRQTHSMSHTL